MPLQDDVQIVSVDDHVIESPNIWQDRLPARYKDAGPTRRRDPDGRPMWQLEGSIRYDGSIHAVAGTPREEWGLEAVGYDEMHPGSYDIGERLRDMDLDGVHAQLCFPTYPGHWGGTFLSVKDKDLASACVRAYNDWIIDEWCAAAPDRQIPLVLAPFWDVKASAEEIERTAELGARAVSFPEAPHHHGLPSYHSSDWDRLFAAAQDADMPLCIHAGNSGTTTVAQGTPMAAVVGMFGLNSQAVAIDLVNSRIFERFPRLTFVLSDGGIGWIPFVLGRCDEIWARLPTYRDSTVRKPSELFREHIYGCFIHDDSGLRNLDLIGKGNVMFKSHYPRWESAYPQARKSLVEALSETPDDLARRVAEDNARTLFNFPRSS